MIRLITTLATSKWHAKVMRKKGDVDKDIPELFDYQNL